MNNTTFVKRVYPENSFTIACGFQLHNKSSNHYEKIRKSIPFILLPDKRTLFDVNQKAAIPVDCFYSSKKSCPHCNVLKKISKIILESSECKICKPKSKFYTNFMALHIDEINIQSAYLFQSKRHIFGPSHNDNNSLAKSMLMFLMTALNGKKISLNLYSKPVNNLKHGYLHDTLIECLDKACECGYKIILVIMDCHATNIKVAKKI